MNVTFIEQTAEIKKNNLDLLETVTAKDIEKRTGIKKSNQFRIFGATVRRNILPFLPTCTISNFE